MKLTRSIGSKGMRRIRWYCEATYQINANDPYNVNEIAWRVYLTQLSWTLNFSSVRLFVLIAQLSWPNFQGAGVSMSIWVIKKHKSSENPFHWAMKLLGVRSHCFFGTDKIISTNEFLRLIREMPFETPFICSKINWTLAIYDLY